jgi:hypothetical protein
VVRAEVATRLPGGTVCYEPGIRGSVSPHLSTGQPAVAVHRLLHQVVSWGSNAGCILTRQLGGSLRSGLCFMADVPLELAPRFSPARPLQRQTVLQATLMHAQPSYTASSYAWSRPSQHSRHHDVVGRFTNQCCLASLAHAGRLLAFPSGSARLHSSTQYGHSRIVQGERRRRLRESRTGGHG